MKPLIEQVKNNTKCITKLQCQVDIIKLTPGPAGAAGAEGPQGIQGIQGTAGAVGPAGLEWQGLWDANTTYAADDAVSFNGASWFCIDPVTSSGNLDPSVDTTHWALLAAQGAQGPQGIQGPAGATATKTRDLVYGSQTTYSEKILLPYDINILNDGSASSFFKLPNTTVIGREIIVDVMGSNCRVYGFNGGLAFETSVTGSNSQVVTAYNDLIKFTSIGANFWIVEYLDRLPATTPRVSLKQNVLTLTQAQVLAMNSTPFIILNSTTPGIIRVPKDILIKRVGTSGTPYTIPGGNQLQITFNNDSEGVSNLTLFTTPFTNNTGMAFANVNVASESTTTLNLENTTYRLNVYGGIDPYGGTGNFLVYVTYEEILLT